jgi:hypothetical protein
MQEIQQEQAAAMQQQMAMQQQQLEVDAMKAPINDPSKNPELNPALIQQQQPPS